jgi:hypothetical protein
MIPTNDDGPEFEARVLNIASRLWPHSTNGGGMIHDGRERDGVFITEDNVFLIETTTSRQLEKAEKDGKKLHGLCKAMQSKYPDKAVKGYFITRDEPTPHQRSEIQKYSPLVVAFSFAAFYAKLCDAHSYLLLREDYPFGSDRDPKTGSFSYSEQFIPIELKNVRNELEEIDINALSASLLKGERICIIGQYGVGKSMALKETFKLLRKNHQTGTDLRFPVYINLRDHHGQADPSEVLLRHASKLGMGQPNQIIRAWRAGYVIPIIDGFDETAALGWARLGRKLKDIRFQAMEVVREFIRQTPPGVGIAVSGRDNYFDSYDELRTCLGLTLSNKVYSLQGFTESQVELYFQSKGLTIDALPQWFPTKPLLLGYLISREIVHDLGEIQSLSPVEGWDYLLDRISERESTMEVGMTGKSVRELIESTASIARKHQSGLGPIFQSDLEHVFKAKFGYDPDDKALTLLQRLPGLTTESQQDGSRFFIDGHFVEVAKTGDVRQFIENPYAYEIVANAEDWVESLSFEAVEFLCHQIKEINVGQLSSAASVANESGKTVLTGDIVQCISIRGEAWTMGGLILQDTMFPVIELRSGANWSSIVFRECIIKQLLAEDHLNLDNWPRFEDCVIGSCIGFSSMESIPIHKFHGCDIGDFEPVNLTTAHLLHLDIAIPIKVGLSMLKKVFVQPGSGRKESALIRGLDHNEQRYAKGLLTLFIKEGLLVKTKQGGDTVYVPCRDKSAMVKQWLHNPKANVAFFKKMELV